MVSQSRSAAFQAWEQVDAEVAMTISNQVWHRVMHQVEWHVLEEVNENH